MGALSPALVHLIVVRLVGSAAVRAAGEPLRAVDFRIRRLAGAEESRPDAGVTRRAHAMGQSGSACTSANQPSFASPTLGDRRGRLLVRWRGDGRGVVA